MPIDHRKILDTVTRSLYRAQELKKAPPPHIRPERAVGLKFSPGQRVKDKVTGQEGVILHATRKTTPV